MKLPKLLVESLSGIKFQEKTWDFWFFSYLFKRKETKGILCLKWEQVKPKHLESIRVLKTSSGAEGRKAPERF